MSETAVTNPVEKFRTLRVSLVADALDRTGHRGQVMSRHIRPVANAGNFVARAATLQAVPSFGVDANPYERELEAVDAVGADEVIVLSAGGFYDAALWGELLTTRAIARGAVGAIVDGSVRDVVEMSRLNFDVFASGISANDSHGRLKVTAFGEPVVCGGVSVSPGDIVIADEDGVAVVPEKITDAVAAQAIEKQQKERTATAELESGRPAADVYRRHGVL